MLLIIVAGIPFPLEAERRDAPEAGGRPKIGLVLSGGGARGVAHIGVLKALERLRVPLDYIAGTSMGAIVGGLYASGMSPEELERWFEDADWHDLLSDAPPRQSKRYRAKQRDFYLNQDLELGISKGGVQLPAGIVAGEKLIVKLRQLTLPVRKVKDFDRLPIPFRAVATNIETGDPVILGSGDLAKAIRASMAVPGIFTPITIDDRLLVDGGLAYNLPVQVVKDMGADIVIAADVRPELRPRNQLNSALAITNQMLDILMVRETLKQVALLGPKDVYIRMPLPGASSGDFPGAVKTIPQGLLATMEKSEPLERYSVPETQYARFLAQQRLPRVAEVPISFVSVETPAGVVKRDL
jgi:NTE family protein